MQIWLAWACHQIQPKGTLKMPCLSTSHCHRMLVVYIYASPFHQQTSGPTSLAFTCFTSWSYFLCSLFSHWRAIPSSYNSQTTSLLSCSYLCYLLIFIYIKARVWEIFCTYNWTIELRPMNHYLSICVHCYNKTLLKMN